VPIEMPKGSVRVLHPGRVASAGRFALKPGDRVTLHAHFNRGVLRSLEPKKTDVQMFASEFAALGRDARRGTTGSTRCRRLGATTRGFNYMQQLLAFFTEKQKRGDSSGRGLVHDVDRDDRPETRAGWRSQYRVTGSAIPSTPMQCAASRYNSSHAEVDCQVRGGLD